MTQTAALREEILRRCRSLFERLSDGDDAPPAQRLRLEGMLEAAALLGDSPAGLQEDMERLHGEIFHCRIDDTVGADWRVTHPFPEIPVFMRRAPVKPSSSD